MRTIRNNSTRTVHFPSLIVIHPGQTAQIPAAYAQRADVQAMISAGVLQDVTP